MRYMLSSGVVTRLFLGGLWLIVFGGVIDDFSGAGTALVWTIPAGVTWFLLVKHAAAHPARQAYGLAWWTLSLTGPLSLVLVLLLLRRDPVADAQPTVERPTEADMST
jgi:hypothetical protein